MPVITGGCLKWGYPQLYHPFVFRDFHGLSIINDKSQPAIGGTPMAMEVMQKDEARTGWMAFSPSLGTDSGGAK